jgi:hypothetical protein
LANLEMLFWDRNLIGFGVPRGNWRGLSGVFEVIGGGG